MRTYTIAVYYLISASLAWGGVEVFRGQVIEHWGRERVEKAIQSDYGNTMTQLRILSEVAFVPYKTNGERDPRISAAYSELARRFPNLPESTIPPQKALVILLKMQDKIAIKKLLEYVEYSAQDEIGLSAHPLPSVSHGIGAGFQVGLKEEYDKWEVLFKNGGPGLAQVFARRAMKEAFNGEVYVIAKFGNESAEVFAPSVANGYNFLLAVSHTPDFPNSVRQWVAGIISDYKSGERQLNAIAETYRFIKQNYKALEASDWTNIGTAIVKPSAYGHAQDSGDEADAGQKKGAHLAGMAASQSGASPESISSPSNYWGIAALATGAAAVAFAFAKRRK